MSVRTTIHSYYCPKCKSVVRTRSESNFDLFIFLVAFTLFLPFTLIYLICKYSNVVGRTPTGDEVVECKDCKAKVAISKGGYTYLIPTRKKFCSMMKPYFDILKSYNISIKSVNLDTLTLPGEYIYKFYNDSSNELYKYFSFNFCGHFIMYKDNDEPLSKYTVFEPAQFLIMLLEKLEIS